MNIHCDQVVLTLNIEEILEVISMGLTTGLLILMVGLFAGGYGTIVGAGGGFIFVPALLVLLDVDLNLAAGSGLVVVLINALVGVQGYAKQRKVNYVVGIKIAFGAVPGSLFGVWLLQIHSTNSNLFYWVFASLLLIFGVFLFLKNAKFNLFKRTKATTYKRIKGLPLKAKWLIPLGLMMGVLSSYLGIGGGWLLVPIFVYLFQLPAYEATATSIFSLCIYSIVGVLVHILYNNVDWEIVLWGGIGVTIGARLGVMIANRLSGKMIIQMLSILLIIVGFRMYFI